MSSIIGRKSSSSIRDSQDPCIRSMHSLAQEILFQGAVARDVVLESLVPVGRESTGTSRTTRIRGARQFVMPVHTHSTVIYLYNADVKENQFIPARVRA
jgi:hypothetical protein